MITRLLQYFYPSGMATVYRAASPGINAPSTPYAGPLLDTVVAALAPFVPSGQTAQSFEFDPLADAPSAFAPQQQTDPVTGETTIVQVPTAWRAHVAVIITTDAGNIPLDSETADDATRAALLALWADAIA